MSAAHTPGPWIARSTGSGGFEIHDRPVCFESMIICTRYEYAERNNEFSANANLIAAAPDLLKVLIELRESADYWSEYDVPCGIVERINAAISKATGEKA